MKVVRTPRRGALVLGILALAIAIPSLSLAGTGGKHAKPSIVWLELGSGNPYWDAQHQAAIPALYSRDGGLAVAGE